MKKVTIFLALVFIGMFMSSEVNGQGMKTERSKNEMRALEGEKVRVILNHVKNESKEDFEAFVDDIVYPLIRSAKADVTMEQYKKTRYLKAKTMNADSTWTYTFLMDPLVEGSDYSFVGLFKQKYTEEEIQGFMENFASYLDRPQEVYTLMQTKD